MPPKKSYTKLSSSGKVVYGTTNFVAFMEKQAVHADFHPLMDFLKNSPVSYALTACPTIYAEIVQEMWSTADCSSTEGGIKFTIKGKSYIITPSVINEALHLRNSNFEKVPSNGEIITMLKAVNYVGNPWMLSQILKNKFRKEWSYFFDTLNKGFAGKCSSFDSISIFVLRIAYSLLSGRIIDIGRLLLDEISCKLGSGGDRDHVIYYPRFLMIIADYFCKDHSIEDRNDTLQACMQTKNLFTGLVNKNLNAAVEFELPEHVRVQLSTSSSSPSDMVSSLEPLTMEDVREGHTSPTKVAVPTPYKSGTIGASSVSQSYTKKNTTLRTVTEGIVENETAAEVHQPLKKKKNASEVNPAETRDGVLPPSQEKENADPLLFLLEAARVLDDRQHLVNAASVLKSQLVTRLTSCADKLTTEDMSILANKCYSTLAGLGDNYTSFSREVNKLIAQHQELEFAARKKEDWNEYCDTKNYYIHQVQFLSEVSQKSSSAKEKLSTAKTNVDSLKREREERTIALHKLTAELDEVEERVETLTKERDRWKEAHSDVEAELRKLDAEKEEARVAFKAINDQHNAAKIEFERMNNYLLHLVRK